MPQDFIYVHTLQLKEILRSQNANSSEIQPQDYSFLNPENIYQTTGLMKFLVDYYPNSNLFDLISFKPHRILLQEIAIQFTIQVKWPDEDFRNTHILYTYRNIVTRKDVYHDFLRSCGKTYTELKKKYTEEWWCEKQSAELETEIENAKEFFKKNRFFTHEGFTYQELAIEITTMKKYNTLARGNIGRYVQNKIREHIDFEFINGTPLNERTIPLIKRETLFIVGGPGSGKSTSRELLKRLTNIPLEDFVEINTDSYKNLLMGVPLDPKLILSYSQLVQDEASFVKRKALNLSRDMNMHALIDQVFLNGDIIKIDPNEGPISGIVVSTKVETALDRAQPRGMGAGRFEDTTGILEKHKTMAIQTIQTMEHLLERDNCNIKVTFVDNNVLKNEKPRVFMEIDFNKKITKIYNKDFLYDFYMKKIIRVPENPADFLNDNKVYQENLEISCEIEFDQFLNLLRLNTHLFDISSTSDNYLGARALQAMSQLVSSLALSSSGSSSSTTNSSGKLITWKADATITTTTTKSDRSSSPDSREEGGSKRHKSNNSEEKK